MPSTQQQKGSTCVRHQIAGSSTSPASEPKYARLGDILFADDAAKLLGVATHTHQELQSLVDRFSQVDKDVGLTISLKKVNIMGHDTEIPPVITIDDYELGPLIGCIDRQVDWEGSFN